MLRSVLYRYLFVVLACVALLVGLQAPNLADQYRKRVDAHLREVTANLRPFEDIAAQHFGGDMSKLIALHRASAEKPFQQEGAAIEQMLQRKARFESELSALNVALPWRIAHVLFRADREIRDETLAQYTYTVPLNPDALGAGGVCALAVLLALELLLALARRVAAICLPRARPRRRMP